VRHSDRVPIDTSSSWSRAERQEPPRPCQGIKAQAYRHEGLAVAGETTWKAPIEWARQRGRLAHRPDAAEHGQQARSRATPGEHRRPEHPWPGSRGAVFRLFFAEVRDRVVDSGRLDAATLDAASGLLDDLDYWTQCWMMTAVWARKPAA
jgi:hypothetical protein